MRKLILGSVLVLVFLGCGQKNTTDKSRLRIVTSFYPMYLFVANIAKDVPGVEIINLTDQSAGGLHDYVFTPQDMKKLEGADVFVINNYAHETFVDQISRTYPDLKIIQASQGITPLRLKHFGEEEHSDHNHGTIDVHFWVSPFLAIEEVNQIAENLATIDNEYSQIYIKNAEIYTQKLEVLRLEMKKKLSPFAGRGVITYHDAFTYLFNDMGLKLLATLQLEPGVAPTPQELKKIEDLIKANPGAPIFSDPQYSSTLADNLAKETGSAVYMLNPIVMGSNNLDAYEEIMKKNLESLVDALAKK